jgi:hypothetical protein
MVVGGILDEPRSIEEWIRWHQYLGVEAFYIFYIFPNPTLIKDARRLLDKYPVRLSHWHTSGNSSSESKDCNNEKCRLDFRRSQETISLYTLHLTKPRCDWLAWIDIDEFILPLDDPDTGSNSIDFNWRQYLDDRKREGLDLIFLRWLYVPFRQGNFSVSRDPGQPYTPMTSAVNQSLDPLTAIQAEMAITRAQAHSGKSLMRPSKFMDLSHGQIWPFSQGVYIHYFIPMLDVGFTSTSLGCPSKKVSTLNQGTYALPEWIPEKCALNYSSRIPNTDWPDGRRLPNTVQLAHLRRGYPHEPIMRYDPLPAVFHTIADRIQHDFNQDME